MFHITQNQSQPVQQNIDNTSIQDMIALLK